jgi:hypothetical protein
MKNNKLNNAIIFTVLALAVIFPFILIFGGNNFLMDIVLSILLIFVDVALTVGVGTVFYFTAKMFIDAKNDKDNDAFIVGVLSTVLASIALGLLIVLILSTPNAITDLINL